MITFQVYLSVISHLLLAKQICLGQHSIWITILFAMMPGQGKKNKKQAISHVVTLPVVPQKHDSVKNVYNAHKICYNLRYCGVSVAFSFPFSQSILPFVETLNGQKWHLLTWKRNIFRFVKVEQSGLVSYCVFSFLVYFSASCCQKRDYWLRHSMRIAHTCMSISIESIL